MKFLVMTSVTKAAPFTKERAQAVREAVEGKLQSGEFDCLYQRVVGGGGVGIVNASSIEELWEIVTTFPQSDQFEWHVEPLVDLDYAFNKVTEWLG